MKAAAFRGLLTTVRQAGKIRRGTLRPNRLADHDTAEWDRQLRSDAASGRLDALVREARRDHRARRTQAR